MTQTFEQNLKALDDTVRALEEGTLGLESSIEAYEKGMKLVKACETQLAAAEVRVEKITGANGQTEQMDV